uniref:Ficin 1c n=1 Tax=Ficus carica TaxID=3494 RepID=A0A2Z6DRL5_FICCA|nr:Ficin 1c [Ficus carica]
MALTVFTTILTIVLCLALSYPPLTSSRTDVEVREMFVNWMATHGRAYNSLGEEERRFEIFKDNLRFVDEHNAVQNRTYKVGMNMFADMTNEEYRRKMLGARVDPELINTKVASSRYAPHAAESLPETVDWRIQGAVNPIRNQGRCGSCWAFSVVAVVESITKIVTDELPSLSEQQLVDCAKSARDLGCRGGWMTKAYDYIIKNGGITSQSNYPYTARKGECNVTKASQTVATIDRYESVPRNNENALKKAVANQPVSVTIEAGGRAFQLYKSGVFTGPCGTKLDHAVVAIGYGSENDVDYWLVRNSWGNWGERGYIKIQRNVAEPAGKCGIAMHSTYPVKKTSTKPYWAYEVDAEMVALA